MALNLAVTLALGARIGWALPRDQTIPLNCNARALAARVAMTLRLDGFDNARRLYGGFNGWQSGGRAAGSPLQSAPNPAGSRGGNPPRRPAAAQPRNLRARIASCAAGEPSWKLPNRRSSGTRLPP